jgi:uncharacterized integral membrane protein
MRIKTMIIILITVLLTVVLTENTGRVNFEILWATIPMSKLVMLACVAVAGFILGVLVGRPRRVKRLGGDSSDANLEKGKPGTLSDNDKEYIS